MPAIHHQQRYPNRPCRMCTNRGVFNVYYWERDCIFNAIHNVPNNVSSENNSQNI